MVEYFNSVSTHQKGSDFRSDNSVKPWVTVQVQRVVREEAVP